jgi:hypothetical protein
VERRPFNDQTNEDEPGRRQESAPERGLQPKETGIREQHPRCQRLRAPQASAPKMRFHVALFSGALLLAGAAAFVPTVQATSCEDYGQNLAVDCGSVQTTCYETGLDDFGDQVPCWEVCLVWDQGACQVLSPFTQYCDGRNGPGLNQPPELYCDPAAYDSALYQSALCAVSTHEPCPLPGNGWVPGY